MSKERPIVYTYNKQTHGENKMPSEHQKQIQTKLTKGLLDIIILQIINDQPMHGYQVITRIRKNFGVYLGPSTVYPLLSTLEKDGYLKSEWNMHAERPRKVFTLTKEGTAVLNFAQGSLNRICKSMTTEDAKIETTPLMVHMP
jgi:PadR family transcriptional regulator, regulatory protein PadR